MPSDMTTNSPRPERKPRRRLRRLACVVVGFAWALVAAELYLRIFAPVPLLPRYIMAADFGIRCNMPSESYTHRTPDYKVKIRTNSKGVRADAEIPYEKPPGVNRIVVLGDSFGMGYGVNLEDTFSAQMVDVLAEGGIAAECVNLSVSGYGNAEHLIMLQEEGVKYQPDIVLIAWHRTDLNDNVRSGLFKLKDGQLVRANSTYLPAVKIRTLLFSFRAYRVLVGNSHLYCWVREGAAKTCKKILVSLRGGGAESKAPARTESPAAQPESKPDKKERLTIALLDRLRQESKQIGAELLILDIPRRMSRTRFISNFPASALAAEPKLHVVSPIGGFEQQDGELLYWERSHGHFTPLGCRIAGKALADYVTEHRLLKD